MLLTDIILNYNYCTCFFLQVTTLYPSFRASLCIFISDVFFFIYILIKLNNPVKNMGKNIQSYATTQVHFPQEREGSLTAKSPHLSAKIWYRLTVHICFLILNLQSKIFQIYALYFGKISSELCKICSIRSHTPRMMQNSHHLFTHVSDAYPGRELSEIPANQAKFAPFTHKFRELRELCTFRTKIHPHLIHYFQISSH